MEEKALQKDHDHDKFHKHGIRYPEKKDKNNQIKQSQKMFDAQRDPRTQRACLLCGLIHTFIK